jgi:hypothetical protein
VVLILSLYQKKQTMKPFDLKKALAGEPVVTRDGRPVKIAGYNENAHEFYRLAYWVDGGVCLACKSDGKYSNSDSVNDLFMVPKPVTKKEGWVAVWGGVLYPAEGGQIAGCSHVYESKEAAVAAEFANVQAYIKIEWEEEVGQFIPNDVKYLHQLQNLYFALTGEELNINLTK